ncbi:GTPase IMAP family member 4 [Trichomycterus rosablanca]|uniref:GTPase IMAP family member 4 n=1 Tax=Trichomycterus rosablanca TaxID=2290929 RepID=UPI002F35461A
MEMDFKGVPVHAGDTNIPLLALVLLGRRNAGKSSAGNTILGRRAFESGKKTSQCAKRHGWVGGTRLAVVDTPGWSTFGLADAQRVRQEILRSLMMCLPGYQQTFLLVIPVDAFRSRDQRAVEEYMSILEHAWKHTVVLFTWGNELKGKSIQEHIKRSGKPLQMILEKCDYRYRVFDNKISDDDSQVRLVQTPFK